MYRVIECSDVSAVRGLQKESCDERAWHQSMFPTPFAPLPLPRPEALPLPRPEPFVGP